MIITRNSYVFIFFFSLVNTSMHGMHTLTKTTGNLHENRNKTVSPVTYYFPEAYTPENKNLHTRKKQKLETIARRQERQQKIELHQ